MVAIEHRLELRDLAQTFAPYPTWGELNTSAAFAFALPMLTHRLVRTAVRIPARLP